MLAWTKAVDMMMERMDGPEVSFRDKFCHGLDTESDREKQPR